MPHHLASQFDTAVIERERRKVVGAPAWTAEDVFVPVDMDLTARSTNGEQEGREKFGGKRRRKSELVFGQRWETNNNCGTAWW